MTKFLFMEKKSLILVTLLISFFSLIRTAWISDDAAITLRTIDNFLQGYGPVFNIGERVQAYTHPLWFLLLSGASLLFGNVIIAAYLAPILISLANLWLFLKFTPNNTKTGLLGVTILLLSTAYLNYSTSGLENPLSHFLLLLLCIAAQDKRFILTLLINSLLYLTRPDLIILTLPILATAFYARRCNKSRVALDLAIGLIPIVIWTIFSIYYYGFPFPNTAYAKLGNGIPLIERIGQGFIYIIDSAIRDPATIGAIFTSVIISFRENLMQRSWALGILLYLSFIVSIGGDFMSGRFLTAPLLISAIIIAKSSPDVDKFKALWIILIASGVMSLQNTITWSRHSSIKDILATGIADERAFYESDTGLARAGREFFRSHHIATPPRSVEVTCGGLGFSGLRGGPRVHLIDYCGLADPLLARLPAKYDENWRIGHFSRQLPENYEASVRETKNLLTDPEVKEIYESLRVVTQLPLNTPGRLREIIRLNLPSADRKFSKYRFSAIPQDSETPAALYAPKSIDEIRYSQYGLNTSKFTKSIDIVLRNSTLLHSLDFFSSINNEYLISMYFNGKLIPLTKIQSTGNPKSTSFLYQYRSNPAPNVPTDRIRITAINSSIDNIIEKLTINGEEMEKIY